MSTLTALDYLGVWVFAMSGAFLASKKGMDLFGFIVLALMPAIAGGTIRDIVLDVPVFWIADTTYLIITVAAALVTFFGIRLVSRALGLLVWFDAVGLAVFCVLGAAKALAFTGDSIVAVTMGVVSAVAGGIVRDVIANETPLVLHKEVYATAAFFGALSFVALNPIDSSLSVWVGFSVALLTRAGGIVWGWRLPRAGSVD
jgi:uncharacterized membrane protein YeiH